MFLQNHFQNAYVTHNIAKAMQTISTRYGLSDFISFEPDMILQTPQGEKHSKVKAALLWIGNTQIELIEPVSGCVGHYLDYLPHDKADSGLRFHHICMRRDNLDDMRAEIGKLGLPVAFEGGVDGLTFIYVDARKEFGHYLEYVWATPEMWVAMGWPGSR